MSWKLAFCWQMESCDSHASSQIFSKSYLTNQIVLRQGLPCCIHLCVMFSKELSLLWIPHSREPHTYSQSWMRLALSSIASLRVAGHNCLPQHVLKSSTFSTRCFLGNRLEGHDTKNRSVEHIVKEIILFLKNLIPLSPIISTPRSRTWPHASAPDSHSLKAGSMPLIDSFSRVVGGGVYSPVF